jgi:hypothetical protein
MHVATFIPAHGLADFFSLLAVLFVPFVIIAFRGGGSVDRLIAQTPDGIDPFPEFSYSVYELEQIIQHLRSRDWSAVAKRAATARRSLLLLGAVSPDTSQADHAKIQMAVMDLSALKRLASEQNVAPSTVAEVAAWMQSAARLQGLFRTLHAQAIRRSIR